VTVQTSPGKTHEWFFTDHLSLDDFDGVQRCLGDDWNSDKSALDRARARVLRVPGFYHLKADPHMVRIVVGDGRRYSPIEIIDAFEPIYHSNSAPQIDGDLEFTPVALALVESWIEAIDGAKIESRDDWLRFGAAFARLGDNWQSDDGEDLRLDLWHRLSVKAPDREHGETGCHDVGVWEDRLSAAAKSCDRKATYRSVLHAARESGWCPERSGLASEHAVEVWEIISGSKAGLDEILDGIDFEALAKEVEGAAPVLEDKQVADAPPKAKKPRRQNILDFEECEPSRFIVDEIIESGSLQTLTAMTGHGKTEWCINLALAVAFDQQNLIGREVTPGRVLYMTAENPDMARRRFKMARLHAGINPTNETKHDLQLIGGHLTPGEMLAQKTFSAKLRTRASLSVYFSSIPCRHISRVKTRTATLRPCNLCARSGP
jgi:AAA domain